MSDLAELDEEYETAEPEPARKRPPDGRYVVMTREAQIKATLDGARQRLVLTMRIAEGPHAGKRLFKSWLLAPGRALGLFKKEVKIMGLRLSKPSNLPGNLVQFENLRLSVNKTTGANGYERVYINDRLSDGEPEKAPF